MTRKPSKHEGGTYAEAPQGELSEVDRLIAEAEAAALEANAAEVQKKLTKKKTSAEAAQRAEELRVKFAGLSAGDAFVEDYAYEWMLAAAEAETGVERQFGIDEKIANLRKAGDALRRLAAFEPKTEKMLAQMTKLKQAHDALFEVVRAAAMEALEGIRNKYKGEETEFERQAGALADSPLVRGVRREADTPEAREQALKHEIVEIMLRPLVDTDMALLHDQLNKSKSLLAEIEAACAKLQKDERSIPERMRMDDERRLYERLTGGSYTGVLELYSVHSSVESAIREFRSKLEELEKQVLDDSIVLETNRSIIEETLREEHDERVLEEALVDLRQYLGALREIAAGRSNDRNYRFVPKTRLAQLIFGRYLLDGASRRGMRGFVLEGKEIRSSDYSNPLDQLICRRQRGSGLDDFGGSATAYFIISKLGIGVATYGYRSIYSQDPFMTESLTGWYASMTTQSQVELRQGASEQERISQEACRAVIQKYPDLASFLGAFFGGESYYLNLRRASQKVRGKEPEKLPDRLSVMGWKESKGGAFVEPGRDARAADRGYSETIERLSRPILRAETAFDIRGPEGEYRVYTMDQAMALLRRSRADAKVIFLQSDRTIRDLRTQIGGLEYRIGALTAEIEAGKSSIKSRDGEIGRLSERTRMAEEKLRQAIEEAHRVSRESVRTREEGETERSRILSRLKAFASRKTGLFGGGGLRADLEALIKDLEGK